ncbi:MAG: DNA cytosine methyltransferase [Acidobacteriota bacterium]|nr:DNA cytosine methyltransferase [Acidobacteriota bacterium]
MRKNSPRVDKNSDAGKKRRKFRLLDLFCCAGGAGVGYSKAGFDVLGVDIKPQPHYPLPFIQADALNLSPEFLATFDAIHASPPCQSYSDLAKRNGNADAWPRLIEPVREMLRRTGLPYVIENVEGAPLIDPVVLCGTMFKGLRVIRHRLFEANFEIVAPPHKGKHPICHTFDKRKAQYGKTDEMRDFVSVNGGGNCSVAAARDAMGISWMTKNELNEAIPPAYTYLIGKQLLAHLSSRPRAAARRGRARDRKESAVSTNAAGTEAGIAPVAP